MPFLFFVLDYMVSNPRIPCPQSNADLLQRLKHAEDIWDQLEAKKMEAVAGSAERDRQLRRIRDSFEELEAVRTQPQIQIAFSVPLLTGCLLFLLLTSDCSPTKLWPNSLNSRRKQRSRFRRRVLLPLLQQQNTKTR